MPKYWRISDRAIRNGQPSSFEQGPLGYWTADGLANDGTIDWQKSTLNQFQAQLKAAADSFPRIDPSEHEDQAHITFFVHGFNVGWAASSASYLNLCNRLFTGRNGLGLCVSFDWPSYGNVLGYYPDRAHARACAQDLTDVLSRLYDYLLDKQTAAIKNPDNGCKAKVSLIAHSMGNYVLQKAMAAAWTRKNQPLLSSLLNQLVMVAADVDNDLFDSGAPDNNDGNAIANLSYRITALYSGRDAVLGMSAGLKHFGTRRLGRSGLAKDPPISSTLPATDNVWNVDCSSFFKPSVGGQDIHGAYFVTDGTIELMRQILRGIDRGVLETTGLTKGRAWP
ncbi:MAG TPA: alpha/beta fold hydrolase [Chthoniobacterales bacterium]|jgi:esterase/lipase superfamily enzyme